MISIIIPTLNEARYVRKTVLHLLNVATDKSNLEVIIVDAGSTDGTGQTVNDLPVQLYEMPEFALKKHASLNYGAEKAKGEMLLFLDADTLLPKGFDKMILSAFKRPKIIGGAFEFAFDRPDWKLWIISVGNRIRYRFGKVFYGDQAVFLRKKPFDDVGGVPNEPLMETAFLCRRLSKVGKLALLRPGIRTSPRRFQEHGFFKVLWFDLNMFIRFNLGIPVSPYAEKYWSKNLTD
ncbi:TIGR04283 family arsenosugar biosynthesis glycosyltransferase [Ekhidna sp.]|uniref:TIGR04283 family arsenosugar biosynthesis glycosyltransferase n=1 Tax=Ekhidna sp. TaxID=2608089 RepID=UPI003C7A981D